MNSCHTWPITFQAATDSINFYTCRNWKGSTFKHSKQYMWRQSGSSHT